MDRQLAPIIIWLCSKTYMRSIKERFRLLFRNRSSFIVGSMWSWCEDNCDRIDAIEIVHLRSFSCESIQYSVSIRDVFPTHSKIEKNSLFSSEAIGREKSFNAWVRLTLKNSSQESNHFRKLFWFKLIFHINSRGFAELQKISNKLQSS